MAITFVTAPSPQASQCQQQAEALLRPIAEQLPQHVVVATGGDGTMLQAINRHVLDADVLFVGISAGHLGMLQAIERDQLEVLADALRQQNYSCIEAPLLAASYTSHKDMPALHLGYAFNDILVERQTSRAIRFQLHISSSSTTRSGSQDMHGTFVGDGIIFASPMGSTAYSMAAGGPIIDSAVQDVFVATPNNPHVSAQFSSIHRPHILHADRHIVIAANQHDYVERPLQLVLDGQTSVSNLARPVRIELSKRKARLLQLEPSDFYARVQAKRLGRL